MAVKNTWRIRFVLNLSSGTKSSETAIAKHGAKNVATAIVRDVGVSYAEGQYQHLKDMIRGVAATAVESELTHLVNQYKRFIVGVNRRPRGNITSRTTGENLTRGGKILSAESVSLPSVLPAWAPRSAQYLKKKARPGPFGVGHKKWFLYDGKLRDAMTPTAWKSWFGPISVKVQPVKSQSAEAGPLVGNTRFTRDGAKMRFGVARVSVGVFGNITPQMVAGLLDGNMDAARQTADGRKSGLLNLVGPETSWRLGNNHKHKHYRPTLEPFLAFAITRSIPAAVFKRITRDTNARITGSAGRTK